jgi:hypothetical protein
VLLGTATVPAANLARAKGITTIVILKTIRTFSIIRISLRIVIRVIIVLITLIWTSALVAVVILIKSSCNKVYFR